MYLGSYWLAGPIFGAVAVDLAVQANQISNQARIFAIPSQAHGRLNTVYMTFRFTGMATGSLLGVAGWNAAGWAGVCGFGTAAFALGLLLQARRE